MESGPGGQAIWSGKLGSRPSEAPGASAHVAPRDISGCPWWTVQGLSWADKTPVIDAQRGIWLVDTHMAVRYSLEGLVTLRIQVEKQLVATPALLGGAIILAQVDGVAWSFNAETGEENWRSKYCDICGNDPWSVGVSHSVAILAGQKVAVQGLPWNDHVFSLSLADGSLLWSFYVGSIVMHFTPSLAGTAVVFADMSCHVHSLRLRDGTANWKTEVGGGCKSTGNAVVAGMTVFHAGNMRAKKGWNVPFGGKGVVRAYELQTGRKRWEQVFDLEANTTPAVLPRPGMPHGQMVVVGLGANPGNPLPLPTAGDSWPSRVVAMDTGQGSLLWACDFPAWNSHAVLGSTVENILQPTPLTNVAGGADGVVYVGWTCGAVLYALDGGSGKVLSLYPLGCSLQATPVIGPGLLVVACYKKAQVWLADHRSCGRVLRPLTCPLEQSGVEHYWPSRQGPSLSCTGTSSHETPVDLTKPSWSFECLDRNWGDFFYRSPVIDAQRNIYVSSNYRDLHVLRPDGALRGTLYVGGFPSTPALQGDMLYLGQGDGFAIAASVSTLEIKWSVRYCRHAGRDAWSATVAGSSVLLCGNEQQQSQEGSGAVFSLDTLDGRTEWVFHVPGGAVLYNFSPVVWEDVVVVADSQGGMHGLHLETGTPLWTLEGKPGTRSTGHIAACPSGDVVGCFNANTPDKWGWNANLGGIGVLRVVSVRNGFKKMEAPLDRECNATPVFVARTAAPVGPDGHLLPAEAAIPLSGGGRHLMVIPAAANPGEPGGSFGKCNGDRWTGLLWALDADILRPIWTFCPPALSTNSCPGNAELDAFLPGGWGQPVVGRGGVLYITWCGGILYALEGETGRLLSQYDMGCASNGAPGLAPGMLCVASAFRLLVWRDPRLEEEALQEAVGEGDPRGHTLFADAGALVTAEECKGLLHDVAPGAFDADRLEPHAWAEEFLEDQWRRKEAEVVQLLDGRRVRAGVFVGTTDDSRPAAGAAPGRVSLAWMMAEVPDAPPSTGKPPQEKAATPAPSGANPAKKPAAVANPAAFEVQWKVVGGGDKGGIIARRGQDLLSPTLERLGKGAIVKELKRVEDRLHFQKISGQGPPSGWVSLTFRGQALLERVHK